MSGFDTPSSMAEVGSGGDDWLLDKSGRKVSSFLEASRIRSMRGLPESWETFCSKLSKRTAAAQGSKGETISSAVSNDEGELTLSSSAATETAVLALIEIIDQTFQSV